MKGNARSAGNAETSFEHRNNSGDHNECRDNIGECKKSRNVKEVQKRQTNTDIMHFNAGNLNTLMEVSETVQCKDI